MTEDSGQAASEFTRLLDDELTWRRMELHLIRAEVNNSVGSKHAALLRAGTTVLYAHWEGFVKRAAEEYLLFVNVKTKRERIRYEDMSDAFVAMGLRAKVSTIGSAKRLAPYIEAVGFLRRELSATARTHKSAADTGSNLKYRYFLQILIAAGIDVDLFREARYEKIVDDLMDKRNSVAHGEYHNVQDGEFLEYFDCIDDLLPLVKNAFANAAVTRAYLARTQG